MDFRWRKLGRVFVPDGSLPWAQSHAMIPTPMMVGRDRIRIYVAMCDASTVGRIGYVDVDARNPTNVLASSKHPVLDIGEPGCFDDNGVNPLSIVQLDGVTRLYYVGYQLGTKVRYLLFTGLALSHDGGETFVRYSRAPILDRSDSETLVRTAAFVLPDVAGYRCWYVAGSRFEQVGDRMRPTYDLRHLRSADGIHWPNEGQVVLPLDRPSVFGYGRPFLTRRPNGSYDMWYSERWRDRGYRLAHATSEDGIRWVRSESGAGLDVSSEGWDSEAVCYCAVQTTDFGTYMFYNGNDYGRTGFGVAVLENGPLA